MKKKDFQDLKQKEQKDLEQKLKDLKEKLAETRISLTMSKVKNVHEASRIKKDIARVKTLINIKKLEFKNTKGAKDAAN